MTTGSLAEDFEAALDPVLFAHRVGMNEPDEWQENLLLSPSKRILLNITRQGGKSTTCALLALWTALYQPGSLVLILAPTIRQSQELMSKVLVFYRDLDRPVPAQEEQKLSLTLANGSRIVALPGTERTVRGYSGAALLLVDEAARVEDDLYHSIRPMLAVSGGRLVMLSTPFGRRGAFFQAWERGAEWHRIRVTAEEIPRISEEFLDEERDNMPESVYRQEYLCSFEQITGAFFRAEDVERMLIDPGDKYEVLDFGGGLRA